MPRYLARRGEVLLHMSHFFLRYLNMLYKALDGDMALVIVLGEISHHNTTKFFSPDDLDNEQVGAILNRSQDWDEMDGCNAYSLSCATGIPRETVRRKIADLKKRGWIGDVRGQGLRITPACGNHFGPDFSISVLKELLKASRAIEHVLKSEPSADPTSATAEKSSGSRKKASKKTRTTQTTKKKKRP